MRKSENTLIALEAALERIAKGKPKHIPTTRKLSVRAVEEEASLGNGSGYYYPEFVEKVKKTKANIATDNGIHVQTDIQSVRSKLNEQKRIKQNYKEKYESIKDQLALFAAAQHHLNDKLVQALARIDDLNYENIDLRKQLAKANRNNITALK
ncbi:hypothetical protein [Aliivibrio fischeri]|uniref:hypothetical protein n=1 Tax=Aliivibrio fischeri TaxID=668 RepID=UPI0006CF8623|nr:hypothetical protein [Aliivibrio fischeri]USR95408.1 hypothetical protein AVFI_13120 [Aliivibrio fischeri ATCC 7744 = JCM 18803 = DSM 507]USR97688.1 hypothetical protein AVFI_14540 [Aliivibrio fischeri ATCC 7744 = JCM 18803 = DSM 507]GGK49303.1 hypothetical protein GCM10007987_35560 [Aliivibrio fischeri]